jgi:NADH:ubiquinone oxidoreductase subunit 5 (subunit L)/multisubunit Na+/H+ antiporter MnhA subunit
MKNECGIKAIIYNKVGDYSFIYAIIISFFSYFSFNIFFIFFLLQLSFSIAGTGILIVFPILIAIYTKSAQLPFSS